MEIADVPIEEAIEKLESGIKRLKINYDRFFAGTLERPPTILQSQVEAFIRYYRNNPPKSFTHRFQMNSLISRYNMFRELWGRHLRMREMGIVRPHLRFANLSPEDTSPPVAASANGRNGDNGNGRISNPDGDREKIETLYREFSDLHVRHKGAPPKVTIEAFTTRIRRCTEDLMRKSGCAAVDFRFSVDDNHNIRLKAKPTR
jgi:hypothetical protein